MLSESSYRGRRSSLAEGRMRCAKVLIAGLGLVLMGPAVAAAESSFRGRVFDDSGGELTGVTVEASSLALAERSRVTVTDGTGQYNITDLRPGTYMLTFTLPGFGTQAREKLILSADVVMHVDVAMSLRVIEAPMTVWGPSPIVDVQQVQRVQSLCQVDVERTGSAASEATTQLSAKHDRAARRGVGRPGMPEDGDRGDDAQPILGITTEHNSRSVSDSSRSSGSCRLGVAPARGGPVDTAARDPR